MKSPSRDSRYKSVQDMPILLNAEDIKRILGISRAYAYCLLNSGAFPVITIGSRKLVRKDRFFNWLDNCENKKPEVSDGKE